MPVQDLSIYEFLVRIAEAEETIAKYRGLSIIEMVLSTLPLGKCYGPTPPTWSNPFKCLHVRARVTWVSMVILNPYQWDGEMIAFSSTCNCRPHYVAVVVIFFQFMFSVEMLSKRNCTKISKYLIQEVLENLRNYSWILSINIIDRSRLSLNSINFGRRHKPNFPAV
jgi:hypothetical protein